MEPRNNPILQPEDYFQGYQDSINDLRNNPAIIEFDKLTYEIFEGTEQGRRFLQFVTERYLIPALAQNGAVTYQIDVIRSEGFKDFARMIINSIKAHQQRIIAGKN